MLEHERKQAYRLELPTKLERMHNVFHVCYLRKWFDAKVKLLPIKEIWIDENKRSIEELESIMNTKTKKLRRNVDMVLVKWKHREESNLT